MLVLDRGARGEASSRKRKERIIEITAKAKLDDRDRRALDQLIVSCERHDGIASIELEKSLNAYQDMPSFFLAYESDLLTGLVSIFSPMKSEAELGALVLPDYRRRGVFSALLSSAEDAIRSYGYECELFVVDIRSKAGRATAIALGATLEHSEYACRYKAQRSCTEESVAARSRGRELEILRLREEHIEFLVSLRMGAFGDSREEAEGFERATFASSDREEYGAFLADGQSSRRLPSDTKGSLSPSTVSSSWKESEAKATAKPSWGNCSSVWSSEASSRSWTWIAATNGPSMCIESSASPFKGLWNTIRRGPEKQKDRNR